MAAVKLVGMVFATTTLASMLAFISMLITTMQWSEPIDLGMATAMWAWLAFFHLVVFMVPLTLALEPNAMGLRWLYFALAAGVALVWTVLLDGPEQFLSYMLAVLAGLACALCWTRLLKLLQPWKIGHV